MFLLLKHFLLEQLYELEDPLMRLHFNACISEAYQLTQGGMYDQHTH